MDFGARTLADVGGPWGRTWSAFKSCLGQLGAMQGNAVCLGYMNDMSHDEVARALKSPLGTVKSGVRRGLESLRRCLGL